MLFDGGKMAESLYTEIIINHDDAFLRFFVYFLKSDIRLKGFSVQDKYFFRFDTGIKQPHKIGQIRAGFKLT